MNGVGVKGSTDQTLYSGHLERTGFPETVIAKAAPIIIEGDAENSLKMVREYTVEYRKQVEAEITIASVGFINEE